MVISYVCKPSFRQTPFLSTLSSRVMMFDNLHRNLSNQNLQGPVPAAIGDLAYLTSLDISNTKNNVVNNNAITGDLSALAPLTKLQTLYFPLSSTFYVVIIMLGVVLSFEIFPQKRFRMRYVYSKYIGTCPLKGVMKIVGSAGRL